MFEKGEYVIYEGHGVCQVEDTTTLSMKGIDKNKTYYILQPKYAQGSKVYTPVDNTNLIMRKILTKDEAYKMINDMPNIETLSLVNDKMYEQKYRELMKTCDCLEWIKIIKPTYLRKQDRISKGKKVMRIDEKYLKLAQENLFSELATSLNMSREEMESFIAARVELLESK